MKRSILEFDKIYLSKDVFKNPELSISEVRLLALLTSIDSITLDDISSDLKLWICKDRNKYNLLKDMEKKLISLNLLNKNGTGISLSSSGNYIVINDSESIYKCKSIRQLFVLCLEKWDVRYNSPIVSKELFKGIFGESLKEINKNWKRTISQMNLNYEWVEVKGSITFKLNKNINVLEEDNVLERHSNEEKIKTFYNKKLLSGFESRYTEEIPEPMMTIDPSIFDDM